MGSCMVQQDEAHHSVWQLLLPSHHQMAASHLCRCKPQRGAIVLAPECWPFGSEPRLLRRPCATYKWDATMLQPWAVAACKRQALTGERVAGKKTSDNNAGGSDESHRRRDMTKKQTFTEAFGDIQRQHLRGHCGHSSYQRTKCPPHSPGTEGHGIEIEPPGLQCQKVSTARARSLPTLTETRMCKDPNKTFQPHARA